MDRVIDPYNKDMGPIWLDRILLICVSIKVCGYGSLAYFPLKAHK